MSGMSRRTALVSAMGLWLLATGVAAAAPNLPQASQLYYPPAGEWARKQPAELGMDAAALAAAVQYAQAHETERALDFSDQEATFGTRLGSMPTRRTRTNGLVIYKGHVVAEFGDTRFVDPTCSLRLHESMNKSTQVYLSSASTGKREVFASVTGIFVSKLVNKWKNLGSYLHVHAGVDGRIRSPVRSVPVATFRAAVSPSECRTCFRRHVPHSEGRSGIKLPWTTSACRPNVFEVT